MRNTQDGNHTQDSNLTGIKASIFDLDGTVYVDGELIGDAKNTLKYLRSKGVKVGFLTNNSSRTDEEYEKMLVNLGVFEEGDFCCSSLFASVEYLKEKRAAAKIYALATDKVDEYLRTTGLNFVKETEYAAADTLLLAFDKELTYQKLVRANELLCGGAYYIATHPDKACPAKGCSLPDVGSFIELLRASSGRVPNVIVGKPYPTMSEILEKRLKISAEEMLMVGDRLSTDIAFGLNSGMKTALVLSGETSRELYEKSDVKADAALKDMNELVNLL